jgi:hypothetical protein
VERRFLGSISIPFTTVLQEGRIEGTFRLETPAFNFGYDHNQQIVKKNLKNREGGMFVRREGEEEEIFVPNPGLGK